MMTKKARQRPGPVEASTNLVYVPSILLTGTEDIGHVQKMSARLATIANGDIATQLDAGPPDRAVKAVDTYEDECQRMRFRLVWG